LDAIAGDAKMNEAKAYDSEGNEIHIPRCLGCDAPQAIIVCEKFHTWICPTCPPDILDHQLYTTIKNADELRE
jgi:hypothetical protein